MIRWGVSKEEYENALPVRRWVRGEELGLTMTAQEYREYLEAQREQRSNVESESASL